MKPKLKWWYAALAVCLLLVLLAPLASPEPDGLERIAEEHGFLEQARDAVFSVMPDYSLPGVSNQAAGTVLAGIAGVAAVGGLAFGIARLLKKREGLAHNNDTLP